MNAPFNRPLTGKAATLMLLDDILADLKPDGHVDYQSLVDKHLTPLEADIRREEAEAKAKRTADPIGVYMTLLESKHEIKQVGHEEFIGWLSQREWPEEQSQVYRAAPQDRLMKLFKGPDGFAVKWIPIMEGSRLDPDGVIMEIYTLVKS